MTPEDFLQSLAEILEVDIADIAMDTKLAELSIWDSINVLGYMMLVDEKMGRQVDPERVKEAGTIGDLYDLAVG